MNKLAEIDTKIIEAVQEAYLWLFDRTGVYAGVVMFAIVAIHHAMLIASRGSDLFGLISFGFAGFLSYMQTVRQHRSITEYNAYAMSWRHSVLRMALVIFTIIMMASSIIRADAVATFGMMTCIIAYSSIPAIYIRKREPPEHHQLAPQGGSA